MKISEILGWDGKLQERFWSKVEKTDECWNWTADKFSNGYGKLRVKHDGRLRQLGAHRIAYLLTHFEVPDDRFVCHSCDNPLCVNPKHLWLGTQADNMRDASSKDRVRGTYGKFREPDCAGEKNGQAKLTQSQVDEIRERYALGGVHQKHLAAEFGVFQSTISKLVTHQRWA